MEATKRQQVHEVTNQLSEHTEWIALLLFDFTGVSQGLHREDFVSVQARDETEARALAQKHGLAQEGSAPNGAGEESGLKFRGIIDVAQCLYEEPDGLVRDLYVRHFENLDAYRALEPKNFI